MHKEMTTIADVALPIEERWGIKRCRYATERCRREKPELTEAAPGHQVRCFRCEAAKKEA